MATAATSEKLNRMQTPTDELVEILLAGDKERYGEIIRRYQQHVWRSVSAMLYDADTTRDIVRQTFVQAYYNLGKYRRGTSFVSWLRTIARNLTRNYQRSKARQKAHLRAYRENVLARIAAGKPDPREEARAEALARCREKLASGQRRMLEMHYSESLSLRNIAEALSRSTEAVRQALWRIRGMLRDCIEKTMAGT